MWHAFVMLAALACAVIPVARIGNHGAASVQGSSHMLSISVLVALIAAVVSSILAITTFHAVRASWEYMHDGVADRFILSVPVITGVVVVISSVLSRNQTPKRTESPK